MTALNENLQEYKKQLKKGVIQHAYRGLVEFMMAVRSHFKNRYPDYGVSGSLYPGYMDMTYFAVTPPALKERQLKIAIVFLHEAFRFEVWLSGYNKQAQLKYWHLFRDSGWSLYRLVPSVEGVDSIVEHILTDNPDFSDRDALITQIENGTLKFITDIEQFFQQSIDN